MQIIRTIIAFIAAAVITYLLASVFYTQQVLSAQFAVSEPYPLAAQLETYWANMVGQAPSYGVVLTLGLLIAFTVAWGVKRVLKPLAVVAYPVAGAVAVFTVIYFIENVMAGGGAGVIGGARTLLGLSLQCLAGAIGGFVFSILRPSAG